MTEDKIIKRVKKEKKTVRNVTNLTPQSVPADRGNYVMTYNNKVTNAISTSFGKRKSNVQYDPISKQGRITKITASGKIELYLNNFNSLVSGLNVPTKKLLEMCIIKLAGQNNYKETANLNTLIELPLKEYMELCELKDIKEARKQIMLSLNTLYELSFDADEHINGEQIPLFRTRLCDTIGAIKNSVIIYNFSDVIASYLNQSYPMLFDTGAFKYKSNSYLFYRMMQSHYNMNKDKKNENLLRVETLLEASELPSYEDLPKNQGQVSLRIIQPFEKALDAIEAITWEYAGTNGKPLTKEQMEGMYGKNGYRVFSKLNIKFTLINLKQLL